jgi:hypothetical protein
LLTRGAFPKGSAIIIERIPCRGKPKALQNDSATLLRFGLSSLRRMSKIRLTPKALRAAHLNRFEQPEGKVIWCASGYF